MNAVLLQWNKLEPEAAAKEILPCCGSREWAIELARSRPLNNETSLMETSDSIWARLSHADWDEAFASHPRIGEKKTPASATAQSANWSRQEQNDAPDTDANLQERLRLGNAAYEERFGRIYIVCATGKSVEQMLVILERRLSNDAEEELTEAAEQQRQITQLRLKKWLQL